MPIYLKMIKVVNFMLCIFYHNFKNFLKKENPLKILKGKGGLTEEEAQRN